MSRGGNHGCMLWFFDALSSCLLWLVSTVTNCISSHRISKYNAQSRGLKYYSGITTDALFPQGSYRENIIVSGGENAERLKLCEQIIKNSYNQGNPMIILHFANSELEKIISKNSFGTIVNQHNKRFDAFTSFELSEICQIVLGRV